MEYQKLDKKIVKSWKIARVIFLAILVVASLATILIMYISNAPSGAVLTVSLVLLGLILYRVIAVFVYPAIEYRQWRYIITEDKVEIRFGIFFVTTTVIPIVRIQHISVSAGPINRKLGLAEVEINTASGNFKIKGLSAQVAEQITDNLKSRLVSRFEDSQNNV